MAASPFAVQDFGGDGGAAMVRESRWSWLCAGVAVSLVLLADGLFGWWLIRQSFPVLLLVLGGMGVVCLGAMTHAWSSSLIAGRKCGRATMQVGCVVILIGVAAGLLI